MILRHSQARLTGSIVLRTVDLASFLPIIGLFLFRASSVYGYTDDAYGSKLPTLCIYVAATKKRKGNHFHKNQWDAFFLDRDIYVYLFCPA